MPIAVGSVLEGELIGVLAGDLVVKVLGRVEAVLEGEALVLFVRVGAILDICKVWDRRVSQRICVVSLE